MEIEFFCHPDESMKWYEFWRDVRIRWYTQLGIKSDKLRPREQGKDELAHSTPSARRTSNTCSRSRRSRRNWKAWPTAAATT